MDDNKLYYPETLTNESGDNMAERKRKPVQISLSEKQLEAMDKAAAEKGMNRSEYIRKLLAQDIEDFPQDLMEHGAGLNKSLQL